MALQKNHRLSLPPFRIDEEKLTPGPGFLDSLKMGHFVDEQNWPNSLPLASLIGEYPIWCGQAIEKYTFPTPGLDFLYKVIFQPDNKFGDKSTVIDVPNLIIINHYNIPIKDNIVNNVDGIKDYLNAKKITVIRLFFFIGGDQDTFISRGLPFQEFVTCPVQLVTGDTSELYAVRANGEEFVGGNLLIFSLFTTIIATYGFAYGDAINDYFTPCPQALDIDTASLDSCLPSFASYEHHLYFMKKDAYIATADYLAYQPTISIFNSLASRNFIQHDGYNDTQSLLSGAAADFSRIVRNFFGE